MTATLTATVQNQYLRVLLQLTFTTATTATVSRVHPDGTVWPVRRGNPAAILSTTGVGWTGYDHEAPLDVPVTYRATSGATTATAAAVTLTSGGKVWLTDPLRPALGGRYTLRDHDDTAYDGRGATLPILAARLPVAMTDLEVAGTGSVTLQTATTGEADSIRALTAPGGVLLLRMPATWDPEPWLYIRRGPVVAQRYINIAARPERRWVIRYEQVAAPAGDGLGAVGTTWADAAAAYATWAALAAGEPTWNDLAIKAGP